jgi:hypothetical protein
MRYFRRFVDSSRDFDLYGPDQEQCGLFDFWAAPGQTSVPTSGNFMHNRGN